jgi:hypothetical protein
METGYIVGFEVLENLYAEVLVIHEIFFPQKLKGY